MNPEPNAPNERFTRGLAQIREWTGSAVMDTSLGSAAYLQAIISEAAYLLTIRPDASGVAG